MVFNERVTCLERCFLVRGVYVNYSLGGQVGGVACSCGRIVGLANLWVEREVWCV